MKIISKYKDFYDYIWNDNDPDIVYVRKEKVCFSTPKIKPLNNNSIGEGVKTYWYNYTGYIDIIGYTFGIYPYIYTVPAISVCLNYSYKIKLLTKDEVNFLSILKDKNEIHDFFKSIYGEMLKEETNKPEMMMTYYTSCKPYQEVMQFCWKMENHDLFMKIESPVFALYDQDVLGQTYAHLNNIKYDQKNIDKIQIMKNSPIYKDMYGKITPKLVTNICFNKLALPIHKYWINDMNNIYSDIENFLIASKLEPEPKISNNGKIIAHGFDLKTSFRKM